MMAAERVWHTPEREPRLEVRGISKSFGASMALAQVSLIVAPGEVHALVGENGCGKSTLVKVLSGYHAPDPGGAVAIDGEPLALPLTPAAMRRHGLSIVHQDLGLIDSHTVAENIRIGHLAPRRLTRAIAWRDEREQAAHALAALGAAIDPAAKVGSLAALERTEVAIARALGHRAPGRGLLIFDEATRALPREPRAHFHALTRQIAARGGSVLLVSHQLDEVLAHADRVTVMRDGRVRTAGVPTGELTRGELTVLMLGREPRPRSRARSSEPPAPGVPVAGGADARACPGARVGSSPIVPAGTIAGAGAPETLVSVKGLRGASLRGVSLTVAAGEILGVTGLLGSGFEELPYLLAGASRARGGTLTLGGRSHDLAGACLRTLLAAGVALVPERRASDGLALSRSVAENVTLPRARTRGGRLRIGRGWQRREAEWVIDTLGVRPAWPEVAAGSLSGGNQQKVLIGKWLCAAPKLLIAHEATQGVDVGARLDIEQALAAAAARGCAVILAGMDLSELAGLCDRILVIRDGSVAHELVGQSTERLLGAVYGERAQVSA